MIPEGATHKLKEAHKGGPMHDFVKCETHSWNDVGRFWFADPKAKEFMDMYEPINGVETPEETVCFNAIEQKR